jgi:hypothetical protein
MAQYAAIPVASNEKVEVAVVAGLKTVLQVKPVTKDLVVTGWSISADAASAGAPIEVELIDVDVAATVTALTPTLWENEDATPALAVGGAAATGYNATVEGTIAASRLLDLCELRPDGGLYAIWFPRPPKVAAGRFLRIRCRYTAIGPNVLPAIWFDEV